VPTTCSVRSGSFCQDREMGDFAHHAIIVTADSDKAIDQAHSMAVQLGCLVTEVLSDGDNGYHTFLNAPEGAREGRAESDVGDRQRAAFKEWTRAHHEEGGSRLEWAEVWYGADRASEGWNAEVWDHEWADKS
jgi:hypothetical protein